MRAVPWTLRRGEQLVQKFLTRPLLRHVKRDMGYKSGVCSGICWLGTTRHQGVQHAVLSGFCSLLFFGLLSLLPRNAFLLRAVALRLFGLFSFFPFDAFLSLTLGALLFLTFSACLLLSFSAFSLCAFLLLPCNACSLLPFQAFLL